MEVLRAFCQEVEHDNPFGLVLKGGTALALYYFDHRESEDLDFDVDLRLREEYQKIEEYFMQTWEKIRQQGMITECRITKSAIAATNRFHLKVELKTGRTYYSKIDLDFVELPQNLEKKGELHLYPLERIFVGKCLAFISRKEFKDLYDLAYLAPKVAAEKITKRPEVAELIKNVIETVESHDMKMMFKLAFRNVDLRFKGIAEPKIEPFVKNTVQKLRKVISMLK